MNGSKARIRPVLSSMMLAVAMLVMLATFQALAQSSDKDVLVNLHVQKEVSDSRAAPGDVLTYTINVISTNHELPTVTAWLTDTLPAELTLVPGSLDADRGTFGIVGGDTITWTQEMYGGNFEVEIIFSAAISSEFTSGTIVNTAQVTGTGELLESFAETVVSEDSGMVYLPLILNKYPPIPLLNEIDNNQGALTSYTVSWEAVSIPVDHYVLQESTSANFDANLHEFLSTSNTYVNIDQGSENGTFYYRVRADNATRWGDGPWSNVESVTVFGYYDDFSNYQSGWPREWTKTRGALYSVHPDEHPACPGDDCPFEGETYITARRSGSNPRARFGPGVKVPSNRYEITFDSRWWDSAYNATYQIFFGSDNPFTDPDYLNGGFYALQVLIYDPAASSPNCQYSLIRNDVSRQIETIHYLKSWKEESVIRCGADFESGAWNHWKIVRDGGWITISVNGSNLGSWYDSTYGADRYFGVGCTLYEGFTPSKPQFDNFKVTLLP